MDEDSLKKLWKNSNPDQKMEMDTEKLVETITRKISRMDKMVRARDRREIFLCILMILLFGWWLIRIPQPLAKTGAAIIILGCILVIYRLIDARKTKKPEDCSSAVRFHLLVSQSQVRQQIKLLDSVLWWYLLPFFIGVLCFFYSSSNGIVGKIGYTLFVIILYGYIYYMNKKVVKEKLLPLEDRITRVLNELSDQE